MKVLKSVSALLLAASMFSSAASATVLNYVTVRAETTPELDRALELDISIANTRTGDVINQSHVVRVGQSVNIPVGVYGPDFVISISERDPVNSNLIGTINIGPGTQSGSQRLSFFTESVTVMYGVQ